MNTERQEVESMINYMNKLNKINMYKLNWKNGSTSILTGISVEDAFRDGGFGEVDLDFLDNYEKL